MNIVFVISHTPDPRMNKRLQVAKELGNTSLVYWDRGTVQIWDIVHEDIKNIKIDIKANYGNPLKRIIPTLKFIYKALKHVYRLKPDCIYVTNMDMLLVASIYNLRRNQKAKVVYEVADINKLIADEQNTFIKKNIRKLLINLEKHLCKKIDILVVTSEKFYERYYSKFVPEHKMLFLPNMPNLEVFKNYKRKEEGSFTIGFIGAIRYKEQMKMLINSAEKCNINVLFAGEGLDGEISIICKDKPCVNYYGRYNYNEEISKLYGQVDCIYAVYDAELNNVRIALPNKLYEAIYCELPIIVAKNTYLAELVEQMGVGVAVAHNNPEDLVRELERLSMDTEYYNVFVENCRMHKHNIDAEIYNKQLKIALEDIM